MNILLTNDDGLCSEGILYFAEKLSEKHNVLVVAPAKNNSAVSHSLSIFKKFTVKEERISEKFRSFSVSGTPADCVKFAHHNLQSDFPIDVVLSGINKGHNLGTDTLYSGTVSAAFEGTALGYRSIAFSNVSHEGYFMSDCAEIASSIFLELLPYMADGIIFNVNFPELKKEEMKGICFAPLGKQIYSDYYEGTAEGEFMLTGEMLAHDENHAECDVERCREGFITVTPLLYDRTAYDLLGKLENVKIKGFV